MPKEIWYEINTKDWKVTVEEIQLKNGSDYFITTFWDKQNELSCDRTVLGKFETSGGAMGSALNKLKELFEE
jgi:hypothetical protein